MSRAGRTTGTWKKLRAQCFERDRARGAPCWICGQPINYGAPPSSQRDAWEPDHRLSVHDHPELAEVPDNIMPSHMGCNRARGRRAGLNALGRRTRNWRAGGAVISG